MLLLVTCFGHSQNRKFNLVVNSPARPFQVIVNDKAIRGNSIMLPPGNYRVIVKSPGYKDFRTSVNLRKNTVINAKMVREGREVRPTTNNASAMVEIRIPQSMLNPSHYNPLSEFRIYDNGQPVNGFSFKARPGEHTITVETGGLRFVSYHTFVAGRHYILEPSAYLVELK